MSADVKFFEVLDVGTLIAVMALKFSAKTEAEQYIIALGGYGNNAGSQRKYTLMVTLTGGYPDVHYSSEHWDCGRTLKIAHDYIDSNFESLKSGDVIDVEFIIGHSANPKQSSRITNGTFWEWSQEAEPEASR